MSDPPAGMLCPMKAGISVDFPEASNCDGERCAWFCAISGECAVREIAMHLGQIAENTLNLADIAAMMPDRKPGMAGDIPDDDTGGPSGPVPAETAKQ